MFIKQDIHDGFWSIIFLFFPHVLWTRFNRSCMKTVSRFLRLSVWPEATCLWNHAPAPKASRTPIRLQYPSKHFVISCQRWRWVSIINSCIFWPLSWCVEHLRGFCLSLHSLPGAIIDQRVCEISWAFYVREQVDFYNCLHSVYTWGKLFSSCFLQMR